MSQFQGSYVSDMADLYKASLVTGLHSLAVSPPGWGKTDISSSLVSEVYGPEGVAWLMVRIKLATVPQAIAGVPNYDIMLQQSRYELSKVGTVYDRKFKAIIADELGRGNAALNDEWVERLDMKGCINPAPVLATSNFMPKDERARALLDRIALWLWVDPEQLDVKQVAASQMAATNSTMTVPGRIPTAEEIDAVQAAIPGPKATEAVASYIESVAGELKKAGYSFHPRRIWQWQRVLFRMSCWLTGDPDFADIPDDAKRYLRFAWPTQSQDEYNRWVTTLESVVDPLTAALEMIMAQVAATFDEFAGRSADQRIATIADVGLAFANSQTTLMRMKDGANDGRINEAIQQMTDWYGKACSGKRVRE